MSALQQLLFSTGSSIFLPSLLDVEASGLSFANQPASAGISLTVRTDRLLTLAYSANGDTEDPPFPRQEEYTWLTGGSASLYSVRMRLLTGAFAVGSSAVDTWLAVTSNRAWSIQSNSSSSARSDTDAVTAVLEIAFTSSLGTILATSNISFATQADTLGNNEVLQ